MFRWGSVERRITNDECRKNFECRSPKGWDSSFGFGSFFRHWSFDILSLSDGAGHELRDGKFKAPQERRPTELRLRALS